MLFYENERSGQNYLYCQRDEDFCFPAHLHQSLEFLCVHAGELICTLDGAAYRLRAGQALLILPNQIHSYETVGRSRTVLWIFSTDWVPEFLVQLGGRRFEDPVFSMEAESVMELLWPDGNRCRQLAGLYLICGTALEQCRLGEGCPADGDGHLSARIVRYLQENYTGPLTLEQMARALGYNYTYLSAYLNQNFHRSFQELVNEYRVDHAQALLKGSGLSITEIAGQCGFGTIRSFNRVFLRRCGTTPREYRRQSRRGGDAAR